MRPWYPSPFTPLQALFGVGLVLATLCSAIWVAYLHHLQVQLYVQLDELKQEYEWILEEQGRLRLEEASLGNLARIENSAIRELQMYYPSMQPESWQ